MILSSSRKIVTFSVLVLLITSFAFSATCNAKTDGGIRVLLFSYDFSQDSTVIMNILNGYGVFSYVGEHNYERNGTLPSLAELQAYDAILIWSNYDAPDGAGNLISDYVDAGGAIVVMTFADTVSWSIGGRYVSTGKNLIPSTDDRMGNLQLGTVEIPDHPIMYEVDAFSTYFRNNVNTTINGGIVVARYNDGTILAAASPSGNVVALNFFPGFNWSGDGGELMRNALLFVSGNGLISIDGDKSEGIPAPAPEYELTPGFTYANFVNVLSSKVNSYQIEGAAITGMEFGCSRSFQNVQLLVDETNENPLSPVQVPLDGVQVYKYEKVVVGVPKASIEGASFTFRVDLGWCSAMGVDEAAVAMYRFDGLSWVELPTTMLYEDSGFAYYSSQSAGLGYFAIAG